MNEIIKIFSKKEKYKELYYLRRLDFYDIKELILCLVKGNSLYIWR